jgi:spermidine synthase
MVGLDGPDGRGGGGGGGEGTWMRVAVETAVDKQFVSVDLDHKL